MRIRLIGQRNTTGIGTHYANFCDALQLRPVYGSLVEEVDFTDQAALVQAMNTSTDQDINISWVGLHLNGNFRGRNIQWTVFETTRPSEQIMGELRVSDQVWVPSEWGKNVLVSNGLDLDRIQVVPEGVNSDCYYPRSGRASANPFVFLFVGKYETRKCLEETMQAFAEAFGNDSTKELVIKTGYFTDDAERWRRLQNLHAELGCENIRIIYAGVDPQDMWNLYRGANAFVFPTRGEGWGLPLIEAAAMGVPIITTWWSGHTEFLPACRTSVIAVDFELGPIHCADHQRYFPSPDGNYGLWAYPQQHSLISAMRRMVQEHEKYQFLADQNSQAIRQQYSWTASVDRALQALAQLAR